MDVVRAADAWAEARKPTLVTPEDVALLGAVMRYRTVRDRKPSDPPEAPASATTFDPEAPTAPSARKRV
jgi:hypothetical protein